jgi:hypothetical protein
VKDHSWKYKQQLEYEEGYEEDMDE